MNFSNFQRSAITVVIFFFAYSSASVLKHAEIDLRLGHGLQTKQAIDPDKKYHLGWEVDDTKGQITFEVEVETNGYVGFGISPRGSMQGADLFIAGVANGSRYSGDYHATKNGMPTKDDHQDWNLIDAKENATHTYLKFSRLLTTCDDQDYPITTDTNRVIWSIGATDDLAYHAERGTYSTNLLMPDQPPFNADQYEHFDINKETVMPSYATTYWCSIHKGPTLSNKHHIIAFEPSLPSVNAEKYTHHFILYNCYAPKGQTGEETFEKYLDHPGNHCYLSGDEQTLPTAYCQEYMYAWAKGGKMMVFPDNVGYPIDPTSGQTQYYMLEVHYDNPEQLEGIKFETGVRTYHTGQLRQEEAQLLTIGHGVSPALTVPPDMSDFLVIGHCSPECTEKLMPTGVNVFNILLHSHLSGRKLKIRHFRNGTELPWMDSDDNYDFNYQQNMPLSKETRFLPGDQLTYECTYDSTWKGNHEVVIGGLSSREEMCEAFLWYYPRQPLQYCSSAYPMDQGFKELGIQNYDVLPDPRGEWAVFITEPEELAGPYVDSISYKFNWTEKFSREMEQKRRWGVHDYSCFSWMQEYETMEGSVQYPKIDQEYAPVDPCK